MASCSVITDLGLRLLILQPRCSPTQQLLESFAFRITLALFPFNGLYPEEPGCLRLSPQPLLFQILALRYSLQLSVSISFVPQVHLDPTHLGSMDLDSSRYLEFQSQKGSWSSELYTSHCKIVLDSQRLYSSHCKVVLDSQHPEFCPRCLFPMPLLHFQKELNKCSLKVAFH